MVIEADLGKRIRAARESHLLTQEEVAAELGIPVRRLQAYEAGDAVPRQARHRQILAWLAEHESVDA